MDGCAMFGCIQDPIWKGVERSLKYMNGCAMYMHIIIKLKMKHLSIILLVTSDTSHTSLAICVCPTCIDKMLFS